MKQRNNTIFTSALQFFCHVFSFAFWILILFSFEQVPLAITTLTAALIHETGHIICMSLIGRKRFRLRGVINGFRIRPIGIRSYREEIMIYLSGPLTNLLVFVICFVLSSITNVNLLTIGAIHLVTALSNMLPIRGYDGYGTMKAIINHFDFPDITLRMLSGLSSSLIFNLCILSLYFIDRYNGGYWIFAVFFVSMIKDFKENLGE